jgi:hypothetical protein
MPLTDTEVKRRTAYRPIRICDRYYRVGDIRKACGKLDGYSRGFKIRITGIAYSPKCRRTEIKFTIFREHKEIRYFEWKRD